MATPASRPTGAPGSRTSHHKLRYLGDKRVIPVQSGGKMIGYVDGEAVVDAQGKSMPFRSIGELR